MDDYDDEIVLNIEELRKDLINRIGTAIFVNPQAVVEVDIARYANPDELIEMASNYGIDYRDYIVSLGRRY